MDIKLYLIRHGLTQGNQEKKYIGQKENPPLCEKGRRELEEKKARNLYPRVEALYASPLLRCTETAQLLYPMLVPVTLPSLMEQDFGAFEGKNYEQLKDEPAYRRWIDTAGMVPPPGGESAKEFTHRLAGALQKIADDALSAHFKSATVITHGGCIMTILSYLTDNSLSSPTAFYGFQAVNGGGYTAVLDTSSARLSDITSL